MTVMMATFSSSVIASPSEMMKLAADAIGDKTVNYKNSILSPIASVSNPPIPLAPDEQKQNGSGSPLVKEVESSEPSPEEILAIKKIWANINAAKSRPVGDQPRPVISTMNVDLSPGSTPPIVRVSDQTGTILSFLDANGNEWKITHVINLSSGVIEAQDKPLSQNYGNTMYVKVKVSGTSGNIAIFLEDYSTPIIVTVLSAQKDVDYRVDFRIPALINVGGSKGGGLTTNGSYSQDTQGSGRTEWDDKMVTASMGIKPDGCDPKKTSNKDVMVWSCDKEQFIIRSHGVLLSPAPLNGKKIIASDMTKVYVIPASPILSMLINKSVASVVISEK